MADLHGRPVGLDYLQATASMSFGIVAVLPVLAFYEVGITKLQPGVRNGADFYLKETFHHAFPAWSFWIWWCAIAAATLTAACDLFARRTPFLRYFPGVLLEGSLFGFLLGPIAWFLHRILLPASVTVSFLGGDQASRVGEGGMLDVVLSLGAGLYEELLFRLITLSLVFVVAFQVFASREEGARRRRARVICAVIAVIVSSVLFSAFHHLGAGSEPWDLARFVYRAVGGFLLGILFVIRGLGVVVYTHAAYDLLVFFYYPSIQGS